MKHELSEWNGIRETLRSQRNFFSSGQKRKVMPTVLVHVPGRNVPIKSWTNSIFLMCYQNIYGFQEVQKTIEDVTWAVFCSGRFCAGQKSVQGQTWVKNSESCYESPRSRTCRHVSCLPYAGQAYNWNTWFWQYVFAKTTSRENGAEKLSSLLKRYHYQSWSVRRKIVLRTLKKFRLRKKWVKFPLDRQMSTNFEMDSSWINFNIFQWSMIF